MGSSTPQSVIGAEANELRSVAVWRPDAWGSECAILPLVSDEYDRGYEDEYEVETADRRSGDQRREAFRIAMKHACVRGRADGALLRARRHLGAGPATRSRAALHARVKVYLRLVIPSYGATPKPTEMELSAEVVRVEGGLTGLQLVDLQPHQTRAVRELVHGHQRRLLAEHPAALDRRQSWLQR